MKKKALLILTAFMLMAASFSLTGSGTANADGVQYKEWPAGYGVVNSYETQGKRFLDTWYGYSVSDRTTHNKICSIQVKFGNWDGWAWAQVKRTGNTANCSYWGPNLKFLYNGVNSAVPADGSVCTYGTSTLALCTTLNDGSIFITGTSPSSVIGVKVSLCVAVGGGFPFYDTSTDCRHILVHPF